MATGRAARDRARPHDGPDYNGPVTGTVASHVIGVISDTHGLVRPEAVTALVGSELILHAGDIGSPDVLTTLGRLAPVVAVRGNNDRGPWAAALPEREVVEIGGCRLYVLHDLKTMDLDPVRANLHAVIAGHSHRPLLQARDGVLYLNPGSAGPRRFRLPIAVARLEVRRGRLGARIIELPVGQP
jgi:putative phosphoesterase